MSTRRVTISWTQLVKRETVVETELDDDILEDIEDGFGFDDPRWADLIRKQEPGAEVLHNEADHVEIKEADEDEEDLPLILAMDDDYCPKSADNTHEFGEDRTCDHCGANEEEP